mmetsp:Transcript_538/g.706  ORF Transcript_538/g.706 Transcript_538/m.706 type:complete len:233 (+) Transcript_538:3162-3860(+)
MPCSKRTHFAKAVKMKRIPSRLDLSAKERQNIWWNLQDFSEFQMTNSMITRSEPDAAEEYDKWANLTTKNSGSVTYRKNNAEIDLKSTANVNGDKWWCRYGHSRRGLEHMFDTDEWQQRRRFTILVIQAATKENNRQKLSGRNDPYKLSRLSKVHSRYARDLALRRGLADAKTAMALNEEIITKYNVNSFYTEPSPLDDDGRDGCAAFCFTSNVADEEWQKPGNFSRQCRTS